MYTSVQRVAIQNEICKRTPFVISTVQQFILTKLEQQLNDDDMATLLRAVKCSEAWLKFVFFNLFPTIYIHQLVVNKQIISNWISIEMEVFHLIIVTF